MELDEARLQLEQMLTGIEDARSLFKRETYSGNFENRYKEMEPLFIHLEQMYDDAEDKDTLIKQLADAPALAAKANIDAVSKRHLRDTKLMDYSFAMVTFVLPVMMKYEASFVEPLTDEIAVKWAEIFPKYKIQKASFEQINGGFRRKWCYITTAVCESIGKPDDCYELNVLRKYRDGYLSECKNGNDLIREYYNIAPTIVHRIDRRPDSSAIYRQIYDDYLSPCIRMIESGQLKECGMRYERMVKDLQKTYMVVGCHQGKDALSNEQL